MPRRRCGNLPAPAREERIAADQERPCAQLGNGYKDRIEVAFALARRVCSCSASLRATSCRSLDCVSELGLVGLKTTYHTPTTPGTAYAVYKQVK